MHRTFPVHPKALLRCSIRFSPAQCPRPNTKDMLLARRRATGMSSKLGSDRRRHIRSRGMPKCDCHRRRLGRANRGLRLIGKDYFVAAVQCGLGQGHDVSVQIRRCAAIPSADVQRIDFRPRATVPVFVPLLNTHDAVVIGRCAFGFQAVAGINGIDSVPIASVVLSVCAIDTTAASSSQLSVITPSSNTVPRKFTSPFASYAVSLRSQLKISLVSYVFKDCFTSSLKKVTYVTPLSMPKCV